MRRMAYADPPYPGQAKRHYGKAGDPFEGEVAEVDHAELISTLERDFPDGWALSTSTPALREVLPLCPDGVRICAWTRGVVPRPPARIMWCWEPLVLRVTHWRRRHEHDFIRDTLHAMQPTGFLGNELPGQKPISFCIWVFDLLGLTREDEFVDLFPGSGAVTRAWEHWRDRPDLFSVAI